MANRLAELLQNDESVLEKFNGIVSKEETLKVVQKFIPDYTEDELVVDAKEIQAAALNEGSLSIEQLEGIAGGAVSWQSFVAVSLPIAALGLGMLGSRALDSSTSAQQSSSGGSAQPATHQVHKVTTQSKTSNPGEVVELAKGVTINNPAQQADRLASSVQEASELKTDQTQNQQSASRSSSQRIRESVAFKFFQNLISGVSGSSKKSTQEKASVEESKKVEETKADKVVEQVASAEVGVAQTDEISGQVTESSTEQFVDQVVVSEDEAAPSTSTEIGGEVSSTEVEQVSGIEVSAKESSMGVGSPGATETFSQEDKAGVDSGVNVESIAGDNTAPPPPPPPPGKSAAKFATSGSQVSVQQQDQKSEQSRKSELPKAPANFLEEVREGRAKLRKIDEKEKTAPTSSAQKNDLASILQSVKAIRDDQEAAENEAEFEEDANLVGDKLGEKARQLFESDGTSEETREILLSLTDEDAWEIGGDFPAEDVIDVMESIGKDIPQELQQRAAKEKADAEKKQADDERREAEFAQARQKAAEEKKQAEKLRAEREAERAQLAQQETAEEKAAREQKNADLQAEIKEKMASLRAAIAPDDGDDDLDDDGDEEEEDW